MFIKSLPFFEYDLPDDEEEQRTKILFFIPKKLGLNNKF